MPIRLFTVVSDIMLRLICRRFVFLFLRSLHYVFFFRHVVTERNEEVVRADPTIFLATATKKQSK